MTMDGEVTTTFIEIWFNQGEIETIHKAYEVMSALTPPNTQILISSTKGSPTGVCRIALSYPLDNRKPHSYENSFTVSELVTVSEVDPIALMERLIDLAKREQRRVKWQINQARRREWLFGKGGNARIDGTETQEFSKKSVEAL